MVAQFVFGYQIQGSAQDLPLRHWETLRRIPDASGPAKPSRPFGERMKERGKRPVIPNPALS